MEDRNREIYLKRQKGKTLSDIGKEYGISVNRVFEICRRYRRMEEIEKDELYKTIVNVTKDNILATRVFRALKRTGINTVQELKEIPIGDIWKIRNCGKVSQEIIKNCLKSINRKENP